MSIDILKSISLGETGERQAVIARQTSRRDITIGFKEVIGIDEGTAILVEEREDDKRGRLRIPHLVQVPSGVQSVIPSYKLE